MPQQDELGYYGPGAWTSDGMDHTVAAAAANTATGSSHARLSHPIRALIVHADFEELEGANHPPMPITGKFAAVKWLMFEGGTPFDAFLTAASAQASAITALHGVVNKNVSASFRFDCTFPLQRSGTLAY